VIFLPVAERELRVAARKRGSCLLRTVAALVALLLGGVMSLPYMLGGVPSARMGNMLFGMLGWLLFLACLSAGLFFTSDCVSQEKREGTLGFLFLTDLGGFDVLLGKLLATSLRVTYAMLAVLPVLAIPLLMGGVEPGHFWKSCLATLNVVYCSLAAGIFVSALSRSAARAFSGTLVLLVAWCAAGPLLSVLWRGLSRQRPPAVLEFLSPVFPFLASEPGSPPGHFWQSLLLNLAAATTVFCAASVLIRKTWQEGRATPPAATGRKSRLRLWRLGPRKVPRKWMDPNPMVWLVRRAGRQADGLWVLALLASGVVLLASLMGIPPQGWMFWHAFGSLFSFLLFILVAVQASRTFVEARQSGLMELLLSTPLRAEEMVTGQWRAQLRMFAPPLTVFLLAHGTATTLASSAIWSGAGAQVVPGFPHLLLGLTIAITTVISVAADVAALSWFGMWMAMTSKNTNLAALKTIVFVQVIPAFAISVLSSVLLMAVVMPRLVTAGAAGASSTFMGGIFPALSAVLPLALRVGKDALFIGWSRQKLRRNFRRWAAPAAAPQGWSLPVPPVIKAVRA